MFVLLLTSCLFLREFEYRGNYPELYSVAISSILGARGYMEGPPGGAQPIISVLERDRFGRVMFSYDEDRTISSYNRVIVQKVEGDYVYFYPHYNFISSSREYNWRFTPEDTNALKEQNNWNEEMSDSSEFVRVRIVRQKEEGPISTRLLSAAYREAFPDSNANRPASLMIFLRSDNYGRAVYLGVGTGSEWRGSFVAFVFKPDHSIDLEVGTLDILDVNSYQTELRLLMEANGWNTPWAEP